MNTKPLKKGPRAAILVVAILTGVLFCVLGISMFQVLFTIIGALLCVGGILGLISKRFIAGIIIIALGTLIIVAAWKWTNVAFITFGIMMVLSAVLGFIKAVHDEDVRSTVSSAISAVLGGFLIGFREGADWMIFVIGALFILVGIVGLILLFIPSKKDVKTVDVKPINEEEK